MHAAAGSDSARLRNLCDRGSAAAGARTASHVLDLRSGLIAMPGILPGRNSLHIRRWNRTAPFHLPFSQVMSPKRNEIRAVNYGVDHPGVACEKPCGTGRLAARSPRPRIKSALELQMFCGKSAKFLSSTIFFPSESTIGLDLVSEYAKLPFVSASALRSPK